LEKANKQIQSFLMSKNQSNIPIPAIIFMIFMVILIGIIADFLAHPHYGIVTDFIGLCFVAAVLASFFK
jgi:uncharacterized membrane protein